MTRQEMENIEKENAIKELKNLQIDIGSSPDDLDNSPLYYALDWAIKALEQEPFINKPCISKGVCHEDKIKVLDKIRAEIEQLPTKTMINWDGCCPDFDNPEIEYVTKINLLNIIDKYRSESEVNRNDNKK